MFKKLMKEEIILDDNNFAKRKIFDLFKNEISNSVMCNEFEVAIRSNSNDYCFVYKDIKFESTDIILCGDELKINKENTLFISMDNNCSSYMYRMYETEQEKVVLIKYNDNECDKISIYISMINGNN